MCSELECGVCYRTYNAGRRCPRELRCSHSFCESCLLALTRPAGADRLIVCPLCRQTTSISGERKVRAELRVDECVLERLVAAGVLGREEEEEGDGGAQGSCDEAEPGESLAPESVSSAVSRGGALRRSWRKVWRRLSGRSSRQGGREDCLTNADLRSMAMMACYMF